MKVSEAIQFLKRYYEMDDVIAIEWWTKDSFFSEDELKNVTDEEWDYACGEALSEIDWSDQHEYITDRVHHHLADFRGATK